jgi:cytochrome c oxidase subunit 1
MYATMLIAVPTGVKVFNWVSTMWGGSMTFETPMLFSIAFVILFTIGGFSGLMLALAPADFQYHDTYFVVAHFHYVLVTGAAFSIMAAAYYWIPKWSGHMYSETWGKIHFWSSVISVNVLFFPQHFLGLAGMPRRIPDYNVAFANFNRRKRRTARGKAPRAWSGPCRRRHRSTPSTCRRSSTTTSSPTATRTTDRCRT